MVLLTPPLYLGVKGCCHSHGVRVGGRAGLHVQKTRVLRTLRVFRRAVHPAYPIFVFVCTRDAGERALVFAQRRPAPPGAQRAVPARSLQR